MARSKKKLSIEELIGIKIKKDKFMVKEVYVESLGGTLMMQKCKYDVVLNAMDQITADSNMKNVVEVFKELLYKSIPMFHNDDLLKAYEVTEPTDIVTEILELGEVMTLGYEVLKLHGFDDVEDEIKN